MNESVSSEAFRDLMDIVCSQLYYATAHLAVFEGFHAGKEYDTALKDYSGFFNLAMRAHRQSFFICMADVLNEWDERTPSIYQLLNKIEDCPSLAPSLQPDDIRRQLEPFQEIIDRHKTMRHQRMAHRDVTQKPDPVSWEESGDLLSKCQGIFNKIFFAVNCAYFAFEISDPKNDLAALIRALTKREFRDSEGGAITEKNWESTSL